MKFSLDIKRSEQLANICGSLDKNLENIANNLNVTISNKGADFNIKGNNAAEAASVLQDLLLISCLLYTSPSPRDGLLSRMPSSA